MKFENMKKYMLFIVSLVLVVSSVACSPAEVSNEAAVVEEPVVQVSEASVNEPAPVEAEPASNTTMADTVEAVSNGTLTELEVAGLLFMREEEKLAGDVYRYFYSLYGSSVFQNIASSEDAHTNSILTLLNQYGIADPALSEPGVFSDPELQTLYNDLIALGSQSLKDALLVGAAIEEIDILDIEERIAQTDEADIQIVYQNLIAGSENHLRSFVRVLGNQTGEVYSPQYITQARYDEIMQSANGAGNAPNSPAGKGSGRW